MDFNLLKELDSDVWCRSVLLEEETFEHCWPMDTFKEYLYVEKRLASPNFASDRCKSCSFILSLLPVRQRSAEISSNFVISARVSIVGTCHLDILESAEYYLSLYTWKKLKPGNKFSLKCSRKLIFKLLNTFAETEFKVTTPDIFLCDTISIECTVRRTESFLWERQFSCDSTYLPDHQLKQNLCALLDNESNTSDVTLVAEGGREFHCHRAILSSRSPVWADVLHESSQIAQGNRIHVAGTDGQTLELALRYIYGELSWDRPAWKLLAEQPPVAEEISVLPFASTTDRELSLLSATDSVEESVIRERFKTSVDNAEELHKNTRIYREGFAQGNRCNVMSVPFTSVESSKMLSNVMHSTTKNRKTFIWIIAAVLLKGGHDRHHQSPKFHLDSEKINKCRIEMNTNCRGCFCFRLRVTNGIFEKANLLQISILDASGGFQDAVSASDDALPNCTSGRSIHLLPRDALMARTELLPYDALTLKFAINVETTNCKSTSPLREDMRRLLEDGSFSDVTFHCPDRSIPAHKAILSARSTVFDAMFRNDFVEASTGVVDIVDVEADSFMQMLHYIYTGAVEDVAAHDPAQLLWMAKKYDLQNLVDIALQLLRSRVSANNVLDYAVLAHLHDDRELLWIAMSFVKFHDRAITSEKCWTDFSSKHESIAEEALSLQLKQYHF